MGLGTYDFALAIGGEAGQGIATPGDILARIIVRRGLHLCTYNAYQSIIRGGHIFLTMRISDAEVHNHGDKLDLLLCLNPQPRKWFHHPLSCSSKEARGHSSLSSSRSSCKSSRLYSNVSRVHPRPLIILVPLLLPLLLLQ